MGFIKHDSIIITDSQRNQLLKVRRKALELNLNVSEIVDSAVNDYHTILVSTSGSKCGWAEKVKDRCSKDELIDWMDGFELSPDWVHVRYGGDEPWKASVIKYS